MGIGDGIRTAAENAMEDIAGRAPAADDGHAPEPGAAGEDIEVHSSISEGSNATAGERGATGASQDAAGDRAGESAREQEPAARTGTDETGTPPPDAGGDAPRTAPRDVPGPAGLPEPDPDQLRADVSEADTDPSTGLGRG